MDITIFVLVGLIFIFVGTRLIRASLHFSREDTSHSVTKKKLAASGWCLFAAGAVVLALSFR